MSRYQRWAEQAAFERRLGDEDGRPPCDSCLLLPEVYDELLRVKEHILDHPDPLACWCRPYADTEDPDIIIHREEGIA